MADTFSISVEEWLGPGSGDSIEQITSAEISISVREYCATQVEDYVSKTVRSTIRVSAEPMAKWILANWWRLKCEAEPVLATAPLGWAMAHSMAAIGNGFVWPDLVFRGSDGSQISIECKRHLSPDNDKFSPVRFLNSFNATISVSDFKNAAQSFIEAVLARLADSGFRKSELHDLWTDLNAEWANPKYSSYRKLEALLGLEPDQNEILVSSITKWGKQFGTEALEEIAAESDGQEISHILEEAKNLASRVRSFADVPSFEELSADAEVAQLPSDCPPWQHAQSLAYALRKIWKLDYSPIRDHELAERLSISEHKLKETNSNAPLSFGVKGPSRGKVSFLLSRPHDLGRRFDTARLIGDYIGFDRHEKILPATNTVTQRQKFQRAFAAEFLCPSAMIKQRYSNLDQRSIGKAIDEISSEYDVSEQIVRHHMENRHVLSHELLESSLLLA